MNAPAYLLWDEAVRKYNIDENVLRAAIESGLVRAIKVNGHIAVAEADVRKLRDANGEPAVESLPRYIPLAEALRRFRISEEALKREERPQMPALSGEEWARLMEAMAQVMTSVAFSVCTAAGTHGSNGEIPGQEQRERQRRGGRRGDRRASSASRKSGMSPA